MKLLRHLKNSHVICDDVITLEPSRVPGNLLSELRTRLRFTCEKSDVIFCVEIFRLKYLSYPLTLESKLDVRSRYSDKEAIHVVVWQNSRSGILSKSFKPSVDVT